MWMEETIGQRINDNRTEEALSLSPDAIITGCPFCKTMISDSVAGKQSSGAAPAHVEVIDVAQLMVRAMKPVKVGIAADGPSAPAPAAEEAGQPLDSDPGAGSDGANTPDPNVAADPEADPTVDRPDHL